MHHSGYWGSFVTKAKVVGIHGREVILGRFVCILEAVLVPGRQSVPVQTFNAYNYDYFHVGKLGLSRASGVAILQCNINSST